jgi:ABC-type branched-subunit amino acid transport system permease subunit
VGGCVASFLAVGLPYWQIPYSDVQLPTTLMTPALIIVVLAAAIARVVGRSRFMVCVLAIGATIPAVVMARVAVDTAADPTSHNLWPLEVVLSGFVGAIVAAAGTLIVSIPAMLSRGVSRKDV